MNSLIVKLYCLIIATLLSGLLVGQGDLEEVRITGIIKGDIPETIHYTVSATSVVLTKEA